jgi:hypothetical protein
MGTDRAEELSHFIFPDTNHKNKYHYLYIAKQSHPTSNLRRVGSYKNEVLKMAL